MIDAARLQRHLADGLRAHAQAQRVGPFTCYLHPDVAHEALNVAMPDAPGEARRVPIASTPQPQPPPQPQPEPDAQTALAIVKAEFASRGRVPRVEFLLECAPQMPDLLRAAGFVPESRTPILACTRVTWTKVDPPMGLRLEAILADTPWEITRSYLDLQREAYRLPDAVPESAPRDVWPQLQLGAGLYATLEGAPAAAVGFTPARDKLADVRGLAVAHALRGRGIASFLLSALARVAHETGIEALVAVPDDALGVALAERAGFRKAGTLLAFRAEDAVAP